MKHEGNRVVVVKSNGIEHVLSTAEKFKGDSLLCFHVLAAAAIKDFTDHVSA